MGSGARVPRAADVCSGFTALAVALLRDTYLPRLARAVEELPARDLWWRPHARATSAGNLLLHLRGNLRQWIACGLGGARDTRSRDAEFAAREGADAGELLADLRAAVDECCRVIAALDEPALRGRVTIQGFRVTRLEAVLHVVEHMSWHAGQVAWIAKLRAGPRHRLAYYDDAGLRARNAPRGRRS